MMDERRIDVILDGPEWLVLQIHAAALTPAETLSWFTDAHKLNQWWGEEALIEPRAGGLYEVHWPAMQWTMRGVVALCTADTLVYSWTWDHEPDQPSRAVIVHAAVVAEGSLLTLTHGPYRPDGPEHPGEVADRHSHREGWLFFLARLHETMTQGESV